MALTIQPIVGTTQVGIHASTSRELHMAITLLTSGFYQVKDVKDDPQDHWHVATVYAPLRTDIATLRRLLHPLL